MPPKTEPQDPPDQTEPLSSEQPDSPLYDERTTFGIDDGKGGPITYITDADSSFYRQRRIYHGGVNLEHVAEGVQGIWIYRQM